MILYEEERGRAAGTLYGKGEGMCSFVRSLLPALLLLSLSLSVHGAGDYWLDLYAGEQVSPDALATDLLEAEVIYAGEIHTLERHHATQVEILRTLAGGDVPVALGMEQLEARDQPEVDRFNRRELNFDELAAAVGWKKKWANYEQYRELCELAQREGVALIALNAPAEVIRKVGRQGLRALEEKERAMLPETMDTKDPTYGKLMKLLLGVHMTMDPEKLETVFEAQVARDETMAERVAAALQTPDGKPRKVLVVCGRGHISYGLGLPDRVRRRKPEVKDRIVLATESGELKLTEAEEKMRRPITITHDDLRSLGRPLGDYLHVRPREVK